MKKIRGITACVMIFCFLMNTGCVSTGIDGDRTDGKKDAKENTVTQIAPDKTGAKRPNLDYSGTAGNKENINEAGFPGVWIAVAAGIVGILAVIFVALSKNPPHDPFPVPTPTP